MTEIRGICNTYISVYADFAQTACYLRLLQIGPGISEISSGISRTVNCSPAVNKPDYLGTISPTIYLYEIT